MTVAGEGAPPKPPELPKKGTPLEEEIIDLDIKNKTCSDFRDPFPDGESRELDAVMNIELPH